MGLFSLHQNNVYLSIYSYYFLTDAIKSIFEVKGEEVIVSRMLQSLVHKR